MGVKGKSQVADLKKWSSQNSHLPLNPSVPKVTDPWAPYRRWCVAEPVPPCDDHAA
jgi:hypothetical protein